MQNNNNINIIVTVNFSNFIFRHFFGLRIEKRHNNIDNNLDNDFLDYNNGSVFVNGKLIKYSFKATYQTKKIMKRLN